MVDAQPVQASFVDQLEDQPVDRLEDLRHLDADAGEIVDLEEAPVVDLFGGDAPKGEAVGLGFEQLVQASKAAGSPGVPLISTITASTCWRNAGSPRNEVRQIAAAAVRRERNGRPLAGRAPAPQFVEAAASRADRPGAALRRPRPGQEPSRSPAAGSARSSPGVTGKRFS